MCISTGCDSVKDTYNGRTAEEWYYEYEGVAAALQRANDEIETAKMAAGGDYDEMLDALENLDTVEQ